ncbi:MAG: hypothetical protein ABIK37_00840 [candidate division WOR-3 bacterium]
MNPDKKTGKAMPKPSARKTVRPMLTLQKKNYIIMGIGLATIVAGFISLSAGSITLAPLLLVIGYCVLIPLGLLLK